jgi:hypothetical protein
MHTSNTNHDETLKEQIEQALQKDFNNLLVKEFTTDWKIQRLKIGLDIEVMDFDNLMQLIKEDRERAVREARIDELKQLWNSTQSDIVPDGIPANDMSEALHKRIEKLRSEL